MTVQELQFELMKIATFNSFDGEYVVQQLQDNPELWEGVVMDRPDMIKLRDIKDNYWNVDTLYIIPKKGKETDLMTLASQWHADDVEWVGGEEACSMLGSYSPEGRSNPHAILRLWWD